MIILVKILLNERWSKNTLQSCHGHMKVQHSKSTTNIYFNLALICKSKSIQQVGGFIFEKTPPPTLVFPNIAPVQINLKNVKLINRFSNLIYSSCTNSPSIWIPLAFIQCSMHNRPTIFHLYCLHFSQTIFKFGQNGQYNHKK